MLVCKDVVVVKSKDGIITAVPFDKAYFAYGPNDPVEEFTKNNDDKPIQVNGVDYVCTRPAADFSVHPVGELVGPALNFLADKYGSKEFYKDHKAEAGYYVLLERATGGEDLADRAVIQKQYRVKTVDPAVYREKTAALMVQASIANGKPITQAQALARLDRLAALEAEEAAASAA